MLKKLKGISPLRTFISAIVFLLLTSPALVLGQERSGDFLKRFHSEEHITDIWPLLKSKRTTLSDQGINVESIYTGEVFSNTRGGESTEGASEYKGVLDLTIQIDTKRVGLWPGGLFHSHFQSSHGRGITARHVGAFQCTSNIEADEFTQISAIYYRQNFFDNWIWIQFGKQDGNDEFAASTHGLVFLHSSAGLPPNIPLPSYPDQEWGALARSRIIDQLEIKLGVFQGEADGGRSLGQSFSRLRGPFAIGQLTFNYSLLNQSGSLQAGAWRSNDQVPDFDDELGRDQRGNFGAYVILDQWLWQEKESSNGLAFFIQYSWARPDLNEAEHYLGTGAVFSGLIPKRAQDSFGIAAYYVKFSRFVETERRAEVTAEVLYTAQVTAWLKIIPTFQYVHHPGGSQNPGASILGIRFTVDF